MERIYLERVLDNALQLEGEWDYVVMHDPQPAAMLEYARNAGRRAREHEVDLALPHRPHRREPDGVEVLPGLRRAVRRVGVDDAASSFPTACRATDTVFAPPCIDPLSVKNLEMPRPFVEEINRQYGVRAAGPARRAGEPLRSRGRTRSA